MNRPSDPAARERVSHATQKLRTRNALLRAGRQLIQSGTDVTMPAVAQAAGISEATAYRHFADLVSLVNEALAGLWPSPAAALAPVQVCTDPVERIGFACEYLLRRVLAYQGAVRAAIAATITRPALVPSRPGFRFGLIDQALDPVLEVPDEAAAAQVVQLKGDLAAVLSAEALFSLTDLCGLGEDRAIDSLRRTAQTVTEVAVAKIKLTAKKPRLTPSALRPFYLMPLRTSVSWVSIFSSWAGWSARWCRRLSAVTPGRRRRR